jgi:hypothetical protein
VEAMPKHKQAGQTTVLTKMTANIARKRLQCRSHPQKPFAHPRLCRSAAAFALLPFVYLAAFCLMKPWSYVISTGTDPLRSFYPRRTPKQRQPPRALASDFLLAPHPRPPIPIVRTTLP